jgi:hypothetical protein
MFVATPGNQVIALDARSGSLLWRYKRQTPEDIILLHATSRGVALYGDKIFFAANESVLVALEARTGKEVWTTRVAENKNGYYMSLAPLVADGKVMVDLAERRPVEDWRGLGMGHRQLRRGNPSRLLGDRQRRPVDGRSAPRRQSVHLVNDCD